MSVLKGKALREAERLARGELLKITSQQTVGELLEVAAVPETSSYNLSFACRKEAYAGWQWVVTVSRVAPKAAVTVTELGLLPGPDALVAPEWVPWSQRLAEYRATQQAALEQRAAAAAAAELAEEDLIAEDDVLENDFSDYDDELDGVDIEGIDLDELADLLFPQGTGADRPAAAD